MAFTEELIQKVWEKGEVVPNYDSDVWRKDKCSAWIHRKEYANRDIKTGWEVSHIKPKAKGGTDDLSNLRPLQWENNVASKDGPLKCVVVSKGNKNVDVEEAE